MKIIRLIKKWAKRLKSDIATLYLAYRHEATPLHAKVAAIVTVGYALSPVDLIPDFVPVLGFVDDAILLPALIYLSLKLIPRNIAEECREKAKDIFSSGKPKNYLAGGVIIALWVLIMIILLVHFIKK